MAKYDVGSFLSTAATLSVPHAMKVQPKAVMLMAATTVANTTMRQAKLSLFLTPPNSSGLSSGQYYAAQFLNSSARTQAGGGPQALAFSTSGLTSNDALYSVDTASTATIGMAGTVLSTVAPFAFLTLGGDDAQAAVRSFTISTSTGTQTATGFGFQPNAAIILGNSFVSSQASISVGVLSSAGQWHISQSAREGAGMNAFHKASSDAALQLLTTAGVSHEVQFSSFVADGLDVKVTKTDTARPATMAILALNVPQVHVGKTSITSAGIQPAVLPGAMVNLNTQNFGLGFFGYAHTSSTALAQDNAFSVGFASSAGNQKAVSGFVHDVGAGVNTSQYANYFDDTHALCVTSALSDGTGPKVKSQGTFALSTASSGFQMTMTNTNAVGKDLYYLHLGNVVTDLGDISMVSSARVQPVMAAVPTMSASLVSSARVQSAMAAVPTMSASLVSSARVQSVMGAVPTMAASMTGEASMVSSLAPDFVVGDGKLHSNAHIETHISEDHSKGLGRGQHETARNRYVVKTDNTSSPDLEKTIDVTTLRTRLGIAEFGNARHVSIIPPSTNTVPLRLAAGRTGTGIQLAPLGINTFTVSSAGSDMFLYTSKAGSTVSGVRVLIR